MVFQSLIKPILICSLFTLAAAPAFSEIYTVRPGDNLTVIARRLGVPLASLARQNPHLGVLQPGQKIRVPAFSTGSPARDRISKRTNRKALSTGQGSKRRKSQIAKETQKKRRINRKKALAARQRLKVIARRKDLELARNEARRSSVDRNRIATHRGARRGQSEFAMSRHSRWKKKLAAGKPSSSTKAKRIEARKQKRLRAGVAAETTRKQRLAELRKGREKASAFRRGRVRLSPSEVRTASRKDAGNGKAAGKPSLVRMAMAYRGARYVYGAGGNGAFDCSGFTRFVYRRAAGIDLPHSSKAQYNYGRRVSKKELKPGDLLFFNTNRPGISHVGIYVGNGQFVHAANPRRGVTTDSIHSGFYGKRLVGAKRLQR